MQGVLDVLHRRRRAILVATALAAGGYASYSYYKSDSFQRRKKQAILLLDTLGKIAQTVSNVSDTAALVSGDFREFLRTDESEVPQSIRQVFKIVQCSEFQDAFVGLCSRLCKEIVSGSSAPARHGKSVVKSGSVVYFRTNPEDKFENSEIIKVFNHGGSTRIEQEQDIHRHSRQEGLPERLLTKLFSESGKGFASAVVGSAVRNIVLCLLEEIRRNNDSADNEETYELCANGAVRTAVRSKGWNMENLLDLASSSKGKALIGECIQIFVQASVSTYLEKTQDVNVFEEIVGAVTNPDHQAPAKEMIVEVCNGAVDTMVRTSYNVFYGESNPDASNSGYSENVLEKILRTMRAPDNRTFIMELARRVTSEAVRSFCDVTISVCAPYVRSSRDVVRSKAVVVRRHLTQNAAAKALVLMIVLLAVLLRLINNLQVSDSL